MKFIIDHSFGLLLLFVLAGVANLWRRRVENPTRLLVITVPLLLLTLLSSPGVSFLAIRTLEWRYPPREQRPDGTEAIIVLGGSVLPADSLRAKPELGRSSVARCEFALQVYRQGAPCRLVLCGGAADPDPNAPRSRP